MKNKRTKNKRKKYICTITIDITKELKQALLERKNKGDENGRYKKRRIHD